MPDPTTCATVHASPRRDCAVAAASAARGEISWSRPIEPAGPGGGVELLVWSGHVLTDTGAAVALWDARGERLWSRRKHDRSPVAAAGGALHLANRDLYLESVDLRNELVLKRAYIPGLTSDDLRLTLLWPRKADFVATVAFAGQEEVPGGKTEPPPAARVSVRRTVYGERVGAWTGDYGGLQTLPTLFVPGRNRVVLGVDATVVSVDIETGEECRFPIPLGRVADWSADDDGNLVLAGYDGDRRIVLSTDQAGKPLWRWEDGPAGEAPAADRWAAGQPPVRAARGRVFVLTGTRVLALDAGASAWTYDPAEETAEVEAPAGGALRRATSLSDGSVLVTGGRTLRHIDSAGKLRFRVEADGDLVSSPVADADGRIYVATSTHLVQIR